MLRYIEQVKRTSNNFPEASCIGFPGYNSYLVIAHFATLTSVDEGHVIMNISGEPEQKA